MTNFVPMDGCDETCPIQTRERKLKSEICCMNGRQCCYFCLEKCPILEEYGQEIEKRLKNVKLA